MNKLINYLLILICVFTLSSNTTENHCTLSVEFSNFRNTKGKLYIFLYNYKNQFPDNPYKYYEVDKTNVRNNRLLVNIPNMPKGQYAISILDDENDNDDLDRFLGIPTEGYGFSNNVKPFLSLPNYEDLLFNLDNERTKLNLTLQYAL